MKSKILKLIFFTCFMFHLFLMHVEVFAQNNVADVKKEQRKFGHNAIGDCKTLQDELDLDAVYFLKNKKIKQPTKDGYKLIEINGDAVKINYYSTSAIFKLGKTIDIDMAILDYSKDKGNIDVEISFILLDSQVAVFWKETYLHRPYRQGVFKLENDELIFFCQGSGGVFAYH